MRSNNTIWTQVKVAKSYDARYNGTPANIRTFLENKSPGLHFAADNKGLSSLKFFWWAPEFLLI